jgi:ribosomal protein S8E
MATAINIKRKNIDLPVETLQKLSIMAVAQNRSLKNYIETILINKANSVSVKVSENPSPSGDSWFEDPENMASVHRGIEEMKAGKGRAYTMDEIRTLLGV